MSVNDFLVEIGTEELPPKALKSLSKSFIDEIEKGLKSNNLAYTSIKPFAAPRRLAALIEGLATQQADSHIEKRGPALKAAYDSAGNPTKALEGFARGCNAPLDKLETIATDKGDWIVYRSVQAGQNAKSIVPGIISEALNQLPIPKRMRWGARKVEFVRPAHWILMLMGTEVVDAEILGIKASNVTRGHRFHCGKELTIHSPQDYQTTLAKEGFVIADFATRKEKIRAGVSAIAGTVSGVAVIDEDLLDEVTALNEWPVPLLGKFEQRFLDVPSEALISSMKEHQKYFHVVDSEGNMLPNFITVANIESKDPAQVIAGNEKVIRPRLSDAAFFFETDKKSTLEQRIERLKPIVFQDKLGSIYDKTTRVAKVASKIASAIGGEAGLAERAATLSKSDLVSEMVLEFTDLQGIMGYHYAKAEGEPAEVAKALYEQYLPRFAGDKLPETLTGCAVSIADKLDTLVGIFGINQPPTGTKDPFALRRAALGILKIIVDRELPLDLEECIQWSIEAHQPLPADNLRNSVTDYMLERFRSWYEDAGVPVDVYLSVHARRPTRPVDFNNRISAVSNFAKRPEAQSLAAANKRVSNILSKQSVVDASTPVKADLFTEKEESTLNDVLISLQASLAPVFEKGDYQQALSLLSSLKAPVDEFFDKVMVMAEDEAIRNNRLALLAQLRQLFLQIADISLLQSNV